MGDATSNPLPKTIMGYEVIDRIGEGAGAWVYAVTEPSTGQLRALKHVVPKTEKDMRYLEQLENEFEVARQFRNEYLRRAIDFKIHKTLFRKVTEAALILELIDGVPLDKHPPLPYSRVVDIFRQAAKALSALHSLLYVHCDFKPNNILVQPDEKIRLIDFGQACRGGTVKPRVQGTPDFMSPELARLLPVSIQSDVYSYGASFYWALTGKAVPTLFTAGKKGKETVLKMKFPTPMDLNIRINKPLSDLIMECLIPDPKARPRDMATLEARLGDIKL